MKNHTYLRLLLLLSFFIFQSPSAKSQILNDRETQQQVIEALKNIYNFEFKEAEPFQQKIKAKYPNHPVNALLLAIQTYWQYLPVSENASAASRYQSYLNQSLEQAEQMKSADKHDTEATFFLLASHSYLAMLESDRGEFMKATSEAKRTYNYMKKGFKLTEQNPEFFFSTGLYNYYREQYPQDHPIVKPIMVFFQNGNKTLGLKQMETGYQRGIFTKTEAAYYLVYVLIKHENNPAKALTYSTPLLKEYPNNPVYLTRHTEALTLAGRYADAEPLAQQLAQKKQVVFKSSGEVFLGLILEKGKKNDAAAASYYHKALQNKISEQYTQDYHAMAYCGLARIADRSGKQDQAREYYRKAQKLAEYRSTMDEIKQALK
ncbi:hypothetical protein BWI97_10970 [Siphonobacter sp. BAB-5405]|uniref:hypothetical protein n=1 Tax=Siphonobacter sp. BAB-5405 TaxID=1864825 RepID=UPI000C7F9976|nr:hypothetical protein [Siphonobacter sp. BAB-5405]PMD96686.1 hypothetical protein BWI97_10970 [Siphonobacter sp. BAB-5405]